MVAIALNQLCGVSFQRTNGLASGGLSQSAFWVITSRVVVVVLVTVQHEWIRFTTVNKTKETSLRFNHKFSLPTQG